MSKLTIVEGNSNDKDNVRAYMVKGEKGYSAYDLYVQHGGTLTEEEWLDAFLNAENYYNKYEVKGLVIDNLDSELTNTIFKYLSAHKNNPELKSYWESLLKEVFRFMKLCEEFDKKTNKFLVNKECNDSDKTIDEEKLIQGVF